MTESNNTFPEDDLESQKLRVKLIPILDRYGILLVILIMGLGLLWDSKKRELIFLVTNRSV